MQGLRWLMHSVAMLIGQVSELRQQQVAMMNQNHGHGCTSSSPCESARFNLTPFGTPEQLDALTSALGEEDYRHQLVISGGNFDVDVTMQDPKNKVVKAFKREQDNHFDYEPTMNGDYQMGLFLG
ncbi:Transmembrane emp24 domain-containing protein 7 [Sparganum proliferum]